MHAARRVTAAVLVAVVCLLAGCSSDDGMLARLQADPVWQVEVPGTTVRSETLREGGPVLGKRAVARAARTLVPDDPADLDAVRDTLLAAAAEAGWGEPEVLPDSGSATFRRTIDGVACRLYVAIQDDGVRLSLDAS